MPVSSALLSLQEDWLNKGISRPNALERSPFRRLPNELIVEILTICTHIEYEDKPGVDAKYIPALMKRLPSLQGDKSPLMLCHICTEFRHLVLNSPTLWSRFEISSTRTIIKAEEAAMVWTTLSGNAPLTFALLVHFKELDDGKVEIGVHVAGSVFWLSGESEKDDG